MSYILFRYLHFIAIIVLAGALLIENMAISRKISGEDARNLARVDGIYGLSAVLVFLFGLTLWLWVGKPSEFYTGNILFHIKLGIFILVALLSIYPTVFFIRNRNSSADSLSVPVGVIWILRIEIGLLLLMPILAVLMARGGGAWQLGNI